jgi:hypothetical protein
MLTIRRGNPNLCNVCTKRLSVNSHRVSVIKGMRPNNIVKTVTRILLKL